MFTVSDSASDNDLWNLFSFFLTSFSTSFLIFLFLLVSFSWFINFSAIGFLLLLAVSFFLLFLTVLSTSVSILVFFISGIFPASSAGDIITCICADIIWPVLPFWINSLLLTTSSLIDLILFKLSSKVSFSSQLSLFSLVNPSL